MKQHVLILFAHPAIRKSRINRPLRESVMNMEGVTFHDLYETYPDFHIDVPREQALLLAHDTVVLHHPMYWYSAPAIMKEWLDVVLEFGFAYGKGGDALHGKRMHQVITTGGPQEAYGEHGYNRYTIEELLRPFEQTATLCGMKYLPPFLVQGAARLSEPEVAVQVARYRDHIAELAGGAHG